MLPSQTILRLLTSPVRFRLFIFLRLPSAYFSGVRIKTASEDHCVVTIPYKWFTRNPFRSTYFACLSMAAEMSTGILGLMQLHKRKPQVSMLVIKVDSSYHKKAIGRTTFICDDGELIEKAVDETVATGEPRAIVARSVGKNKAGEVVAEYTRLPLCDLASAVVAAAAARHFACGALFPSPPPTA